MSQNPLASLVQTDPASTAPTVKIRSAAVTTTMPLAITLDGFPQAVTPTDVLLSGLRIGDRVCCLHAGTRLVVLGRYGG